MLVCLPDSTYLRKHWLYQCFLRASGGSRCGA